MRLTIDYVPCGRRDERNYSGESRWWGKRYFFHKTVDKILKVSTTLKPIGVSGSRTLSAITLDSGKNGETWTTNVENDSILLPYFRSDPNGLAAFDITFSSTRDYKTSIAGDALDVVKRAAALISPTSSLVTTVNKDRFNDAASFVDSTIDGLLKVAINEKVHLDVPLRQGTTLVTLTLFEPGANDPYPSAKWPLRPIGQWRIRAEPLESKSIFAPSPGDDEGKISAASILNFHVSDDKTVNQALTGAANVQSARDALLAADRNGLADAAVALCRATAIESDGLGFSHGDSGKIVWAYLTTVGLSATDRSSAREACKQHLEFFWIQPGEKAEPAPVDPNEPPPDPNAPAESPNE